MKKKDIEALEEIVASQVCIVDEILDRYTLDEAGEGSRYAFIEMSDIQKLKLLTFTMENCPDWSDFETELVINFDYGRY